MHCCEQPLSTITSLAGSSLTPTCCQCWVPASPPRPPIPLSSATGCPTAPSTMCYMRGQVSANRGDAAEAGAGLSVLGGLPLCALGQQCRLLRLRLQGGHKQAGSQPTHPGPSAAIAAPFPRVPLIPQ